MTAPDLATVNDALRAAGYRRLKGTRGLGGVLHYDARETHVAMTMAGVLERLGYTTRQRHSQLTVTAAPAAPRKETTTK